MRSVGLTNFGYRRQLQDWLDLSIQKNIPVSLLIMSRAFSITSNTTFEPEEVLKGSISSLTNDTINEVVLAATLPSEQNSKDFRKRKLESIEFQEELIGHENVEVDIAKAEKAAVELKHQSSSTTLNDIKPVIGNGEVPKEEPQSELKVVSDFLKIFIINL